MKIIDTSDFTKEIHFPVTKAIYNIAPKRVWYQKIVNFITYRRWFEVDADYVLWVPILGSYIFVPKTFLFDGASVPKILNSIFSPTGILLLGALPHDFGYRYEKLILIDEMTGELYIRSFTKSELDEIFESLCVWESGFKKASAVAEKTLALAGSIGWRENRKKNSNLHDDFPEIFEPGAI